MTRGGRRPIDVWVTGGGTREPIDDVRWVGNVSTGRMACEVARAAARRGDRVTLFLAELAPAPRSPRVAVRRFVTAEQLRRALASEAPAPDAIVHAAAVADYAPLPRRGKVPSGRGSWTLRMRPLPKIVAELRLRHPRAVLCMFKLESGVSLDELRRRATEAARRAGADLVFANRLEDVGAEHRGFLLDLRRDRIAETRTRAAAASAILRACRDGAADRRGRAGRGSKPAKGATA